MDTYIPQSAEQAIQEFWQNAKTYITENNPGPLYSIDTPPPTVSGSLHIGHVFSYTQADILARYKRMSGYSVFYPFGFDDNGLPTERFVEKKLGVSAFSVGRSAFIEMCLSVTHETEKQFQDLWQRMGLSIDWSKCYSTISESTRRISQKSFLELLKKEYVYRREEPALYCPACRTSVAQAELDDTEKPSQFTDIAFTSAVDGAELVIGTTRPELLGSVVALLFNPADSRYRHLEGTEAIVPLFGLRVPIMADDMVKIDKGTGLVMCATFGDKTDVEWYKKHKLPYRPTIGRDGRMVSEAGILAGKKVAEARVIALEALKEADLIRGSQAITHSVNIHERCKNDIEYLALPQWFLKLLPFKQQFIEMGDKVDWNPAHMKSRYNDWVENLSWDWCLSRQRFFGIPFPVWYCLDCDAILVPEEKDLPIDPQEVSLFSTCTACKSERIVPDTDVMDTWNTSSLTPYIVRELYQGDKSEFLPMSMRPQAHDIIRTWAFDTIVKVWMHDGKIPWDTILISGHVLSGQGGKISKSQGNSPLVPENLLKMYPADVIRYWTSTATLGTDVAFSETQLKIGHKLLTKLWNAFKFIREHTQNLTPGETVNAVSPLNQWILYQAMQSYKSYQQYFEKYEMSLALESIERFFWADFCDNYLELIKDQLFHPELYTHEQIVETRRVLYQIGLRIIQMLAPFMPHITDTLYKEMYEKNTDVQSIHQLRYNRVQVPNENTECLVAMNVLLEVVGGVRKLKSDNHLSLKTDLNVLYVLSADPGSVGLLLKPLEQVIKGVSRAKLVEYRHHGDVSISTLEQRDGAWFAHVVVP